MVHQDDVRLTLSEDLYCLCSVFGLINYVTLVQKKLPQQYPCRVRIIGNQYCIIFLSNITAITNRFLLYRF